MEDASVLSFKILAGKQPPKEYLEAFGAGYLEAFRTPVPGGAEIVLARSRTGIINGNKKRVFMLSELPPKEILSDKIAVQFTTMKLGKEDEAVEGQYGMADGRLFFVVGGSSKKPRPKKS